MYGRNDRFAPGSVIVCDCGSMRIVREGDVYKCYGTWYCGEWFIHCPKCNDKVRYMPEVIGGELIKGGNIGTRTIIW